MIFVGQPLLQHTCGLVVSVPQFNCRSPSSICGEGRIFIYLSTYCQKTTDGERRPNFAIFVVWSASYVSAEFLEREGII